MTKVRLMTKERHDHNGSMMAYLKVMYYFGFLPFSWVSERDPEHYEFKFRISGLKTFIMLMMDLLLSLLVLAYFYVFNILNVDPNFDPRQLLNPSYFLALNDGVMTTSLTQMVFVAILLVGSWAYSLTGKSVFHFLRANLKTSYYLNESRLCMRPVWK